jgi:hypothetical protein
LHPPMHDRFQFAQMLQKADLRLRMLDVLF